MSWAGYKPCVSHYEVGFSTLIPVGYETDRGTGCPTVGWAELGGYQLCTRLGLVLIPVGYGPVYEVLAASWMEPSGYLHVVLQSSLLLNH